MDIFCLTCSIVERSLRSNSFKPGGPCSRSSRPTAGASARSSRPLDRALSICSPPRIKYAKLERLELLASEAAFRLLRRLGREKWPGEWQTEARAMRQERLSSASESVLAPWWLCSVPRAANGGPRDVRRHVRIGAASVGDPGRRFLPAAAVPPPQGSRPCPAVRPFAFLPPLLPLLSPWTLAEQKEDSVHGRERAYARTKARAGGDIRWAAPRSRAIAAHKPRIRSRCTPPRDDRPSRLSLSVICPLPAVRV